MKHQPQLDAKLTKSRDFKSIVGSILKNMFRVEIYSSVRRIYIDLNSCLSILFRYDDINSNEITETISKNLEGFLQTYLNDGVKIYIIFSLHPSIVHTHIFTDWCKERYKRVDYSKCGFLQKLILSLNNFSKENPLIKIINSKDKHPAMIIHEQERLSKSLFCVLSKDSVIQCLPIPTMHIWTGVNYIEQDDPDRIVPDNVELPEPVELFLPYYMTIRGDARNEYKGVDGYGPQRTSKYLHEQKIRIKANLEHPLKEYTDKYIGLFDINNMNDVYSEITRDKNKSE